MFSGGPMQILDSDIECVYHVVGVISSGFSCGTTTPGFYVKVSSHLDWIEKHVWPGES
jgi:secreted trypsin-like serine protease